MKLHPSTRTRPEMLLPPALPFVQSAASLPACRTSPFRVPDNSSQDIHPQTACGHVPGKCSCSECCALCSREPPNMSLRSLHPYSSSRQSGLLVRQNRQSKPCSG